MINVYVQDGDPTQVVELLETQEKKRKEGNDFKVLVESIFKKTLLNLSCVIIYKYTLQRNLICLISITGR